ncbi:MAG: tRNA (N6-threonylcarbamoyladenosine(37)-N6)-methyltransferase TrmO [Pseudobutyrivibrio sp.]|nr:tRNA (N6-threonylcarbamoyladenosine(37)-N6)-methyltransferase TrmO [Pseudobutyrivibrio sp.]
MELKKIGIISTGFTQKFGIPRQSGLVSEIGHIIFEPEFRDSNYIDGIKDYDYLWLIWGFSKNKPLEGAKVRPPRLGGQTMMGVFATRSPYRPNNIGLSSVELVDVLEYGDPDYQDIVRSSAVKSVDGNVGPILAVSGVDMLDGTPIYDIKPYLAYADSHPEAKGGFTDGLRAGQQIEVEFDENLLHVLPEKYRKSAKELLNQDPRAGYDRDKERDFKLSFHGYDITFIAKENRLVVTSVIKL